MRAIVVDDEALMLRKFERLAKPISDLRIVGMFEEARLAVDYVKNNPVEAAFIDIEMPIMSGLELAHALKRIRKDILLVFITAHESYINEANAIGGDYYIVKPYTKKVLLLAMEKLRVLSSRQDRRFYIQTFGRFVVKKEGVPIRLSGKPKEILALIVTKCGKEISNEEIFSTIWEDRPYSNRNMTVYYNALRRLKDALHTYGAEELLISTTRGQILNITICDCDYFSWREKNPKREERFEGEFMSEYSWGESILAEIAEDMYGEGRK